MLVGEPPGRWPTEDAVRTGRFLEATASHRLRLTEAGSRLEGALVHAVAIRLDQRTLTPGALIDELSGAASPPRRRYSGGEVQEIVKRASELEATTPTAGGAMTLGGVEALAAEVGIASRVVRAAAESLVPAPAPAPAAGLRRNRWVGGPTTLLFERVVEGEVPDSEWLGLVDEIRRVMNNVGQVSQFGRSFSWVAARRGASQRDLEVAVSVRGGQTRITIRENLASVMGAVFGGIGGGGGRWRRLARYRYRHRLVPPAGGRDRSCHPAVAGDHVYDGPDRLSRQHQAAGAGARAAGGPAGGAGPGAGAAAAGAAKSLAAGGDLTLVLVNGAGDLQRGEHPSARRVQDDVQRHRRIGEVDRPIACRTATAGHPAPS